MKSTSFRAILVLALTLGTLSSAWAQFHATISGTVVDPAGAAVPGATVTLTPG